MSCRAVLILPALLAACAPAPEEGGRTDAAHGAALYAKNCAACHGADAKGDGTESLGLGTPPPDLTGLAARNGGTFPRDYVLTTIDGAARANDPDAAMPEFGAHGLEHLEIPAHNMLASPLPTDLFAITAYLETLQTP